MNNGFDLDINWSFKCNENGCRKCHFYHIKEYRGLWNCMEIQINDLLYDLSIIVRI